MENLCQDFYHDHYQLPIEKNNSNIQGHNISPSK